ncbi:MAG: alpha-L-rhamnosidase [Pseudozobellia sp.]|nr:alpha-L-rhamnosidase [Pseudozobellia sp.]
MKIFQLNLIILAFLATTIAWAQSNIDHLQVEYQPKPLGIDVQTPHFSWQMVTKNGVRGQAQSAYRILVIDERGRFVWDSGKVDDNHSVGIAYEGEQLAPTTRYDYTVTVWDETGETSANSSSFETGLMKTDISAWNGAQWIGGGDDDLVFNSHYLSVFKFGYSIKLHQKSKSSKASFLLGGNDPRLMDKNLNIQGVENSQDQSYIAFELDISGLNGSETGMARLNVYRVGYSAEDSKTEPFRSFEISRDLINDSNKYELHTVNAECVFGFFQVWLDGTEEKNKVSTNDNQFPPPRGKVGFNLNPVGRGNDYISFPMVGDIGFSVDKDQSAIFSNVQIRNYRSPSNLLFQENLDSDQKESIFYSKADKALSITPNGYEISGRKGSMLLLENPSKNANPMLRTTFSSENKSIAKARLYVTSRGIYEIYLNGNRVGDDYFNPGLTQYNKSHMYQTYDVTDMLRNGEANALGAWLSEGWWSGNITYTGENWNYFGDRPSLLAQMIITYSDGSEQKIVSNDTDWKLYTSGPITYGSFFQGEVYDARLEDNIKGWSTTNFDDSNWKKAVQVPLKGTTFQDNDLNYDSLKLMGQIGRNAKVVKTLKAQSVEEVRPGVFVYDMGQNMVGVPKIELPSGSKGDTITLRYSEVTYPDLEEYGSNVGMVMLENIRAALAQDIYIRKGGDETIAPRFTFHGYRFLEISGINEPLPLEKVAGQVISSIDELASNYQTSNELVNKLWENITWSLRGNFLSIPTDTPARNERMGWSGDINVFSKAATYLTQAEPFLRRHLLAMRDIQTEEGRFTDVAPVGGGFGGTLWGSAGIIIPWEMYLQYGDLQVLQEHYGAMKKYMEFLNSKIDTESGILNEGPLGDWLSPEGYKNDDTFFWASYHLYNLEILSNVAELLGNDSDAESFKKRYDERKSFLNATYLDSKTGKTLHLGHQSLRFGPPLPADMRKEKGDFVDTQASYAIPLNLGVLNEENHQKGIEHLVATINRENTDDLGQSRPEYSLMTGFIGTASLNHALSKNGKHETAYKLLQQTTYPSWLYSVENGATTIWERLNSYTVENGFGGNNSMNSFNHYSFGAVAAWMYNYSLGIQSDSKEPGFKHIILQPTPDPTKQMKWAKGHYDSMYGKIESEWRWAENGWDYNVTIPANTTATLFISTDNIKNISESEKKVGKLKEIKILAEEEEAIKLQLVSGKYQFHIKN